MRYIASTEEIFDIVRLSWDILVEGSVSSASNVESLENLSAMIVDLTDRSDDLCLAFGQKGLLQVLAEDIRTGNISEYLTSIALTIIYNCCWRVPENRVLCREYIDILEDCSQSEIPDIQADAFLALSYIVDKSEVHKISLNEPCLKFLLLALKSAMSSSDRRSRGYSALEILQGINQLALNDSNKLLIVKLDEVDVMESVLVEEGSNDKEKLWAARAVWQLAFKEENKIKFRQRTKLLDPIKGIKESADDWDLKDACSGALFVINDVFDIDDAVKGHTPTRDREDVSGHSSVIETHSSDHAEGHIMISYQHSSQERMLRVKSYLEERGYNVWMDVDKMRGDILEAMAQAVQRAAVVLVCMTRRFKDSQHCRTATYAYTLKKDIIPLMLQDQFKPVDWLGALIGMKKYFSIYSDDVMSSSLPKLVRELGDRGKLRNSDLVVPLLDELRGASSPFIRSCEVQLDDTNEDEVDGSGGIKDNNPTDNKDKGNSRSEKMVDVASWDEEETGEWLKSHGVDTSKGSFKRVNGTRLKQIKKLLQVAPDFCLKSLKDELCIDLWDVLSLVDALEKL